MVVTYSWLNTLIVNRLLLLSLPFLEGFTPRTGFKLDNIFSASHNSTVGASQDNTKVLPLFLSLVVYLLLYDSLSDDLTHYISIHFFSSLI
jgi:hypothetical protein